MVSRRTVRSSILLSAALFAAWAPAARAEVFELLDKTKMNGKLIHYYDGVFTVETQGQTVKVPKEKIKSVSFQLPPARAEFSTPEKTFERWRKALVEGNVEKVIDCYALMYQGMLATQMGQATEGLKKMQKVKGETATLKVTRQKGDESDTGDVVFVRENGEWKMLPPQP